jgi:DNA polymerase
MMATVQDLNAYLEWQSDMGTDEVILPAPWVKRQAASESPVQRGADRAPIGNGLSAGSPDYAPGAAAGSTPVAPGHAQASQTGSGLAGAASHGNGHPGEDAFDPAQAGLFESLSRALKSAGAAKSPAAPLPSASAAGPAPAAPARASEAHNLPAFASLGGFWDHLEKRPHLLHGEALETSGLPVARTVRSVGPAGASLALIGFGPSDADAAEGSAFRGEAGALLEKMMRAIKLDTAALYLGNLLKVKVAGKAWSRRELARIVPLLHAELALARIPMVLLLGQECAQAVLKTGKTLDELRQETHRQEGREFFVTYHPEELLRKEELKRKAWEDLQWLQRRMAEKART